MKNHQKRTEIKLPEQERHLAALHALTATASGALDLEEVLDGVIQEITNIFKFDTTRIFLFNNEMTELHLRASYETNRENFARNQVFKRGQGNIGRVAETGIPLIYENIQTDTSYDRVSQTTNTKRAGFNFLATFPIMSKNKTFGTILCIGVQPRRLTTAEIQLITSMANQTAVVIEYAKLLEESQQKTRALSALYSVSEIAGQSLEIDTILRDVMRKLLEIFNFDAGRLYFRVGETDEIRLLSYQGFPPGLEPVVSFRAGVGLIGKIYQTGEPVLFADMAVDSEYQQLARRKVMLKAGFNACFFVPIRVRGESVGLMQILNRETHPFSETEQRLITSIAYHLGVAMENASLFGEVTEKSAELEKANGVKNEFLAVMTHELKTPISTILGYTALMKERMCGEITGEQEKALQIITTQSEELLGLVNNILQTTRIEADGVELETQEVQPLALLAELRKTFDVNSNDEVKLIWDYPADLPVLKTDKDKLKHILQNLINNALKFTEKGTVLVSARCHREAKDLVFKVADTGVGIPNELLPTIFEMFQQQKGVVTEEARGVG
ncbi:MAG: GAF domain-containing protein, partial [Deltaproteobacteria bacterium]|nr:GAF domain-containing protein [Deltaproteobacteria bacterium]